MLSHLRLRAIDNVVLDSASSSGKIVHVKEVQYSHANDSFLSDLKGLKSTVSAGSLLSYDGSNVVELTASDFLNNNSSALQTTFDSRYLQPADASSTYLAQADQYITSVGANLSVSGKELNVDLTGYLQTADFSNYPTLSEIENQFVAKTDEVVQTVGANLSLDGHELNVDLSAYAVSSDVARDFVAKSDEYIQSVGANLSVSGNELNVDLTGYLQTADFSNYPTLSDIENQFVAKTDEVVQTVGANLSLNGHELNVDLSSYALSSDVATNYVAKSDEYVTGVSADFEVNAGVLSVASGTFLQPNMENVNIGKNLTMVDADSATFSKTIHRFALVNTNYHVMESIQLEYLVVYRIEATAVFRGGSDGCVKRSGLFKYDGSGLHLIDGTDSSEVVSFCDGSEFILQPTGSTVDLCCKATSGLANSAYVVLKAEIMKC